VENPYQITWYHLVSSILFSNFVYLAS
jgi:hypothetical protein